MADSGCKTIKQYLSNFPSLLSFIGSKIESTLFPTNSNFICNELHFEYSHTARIDSTCSLRFRTYSPNLYYCQQGAKKFFKRGVYFGPNKRPLERTISLIGGFGGAIGNQRQ